MSLYWRYSDLGGLGVTMEIMDGDGETLLNAFRACRMSVPPSMTMNRSLHLIIDYLLKGD